MLYQIPIILLFLAIPGMEPIRGRRDCRGFGLLVLPVLAGLLLVPNLPLRRCEVRPCLQHVAERIRPGDRVAIDTRMRPAFLYYAVTGRVSGAFPQPSDDDREDGRFAFLAECSRSPESCLWNMPLLAGRTWVVLGWTTEGDGGGAPKPSWRGKILRWLTRRYTSYDDGPHFVAFERHLVEHHGGRLLEGFATYGAKASLYEFPPRSGSRGGDGGPVRRERENAVEVEAALDAQEQMVFEAVEVAGVVGVVQRERERVGAGLEP